MEKGKSDLVAEFQFNGYAFTELQFLLKENIGVKSVKPLNLAFEVELILDENSEKVDVGQIELTCSIDNNKSDYDSPFHIKVVMQGFFSTRTKVSSEKMAQFLKVNGLAAMLPFLRSAAADLSKISNATNTLILPMMNLSTLKNTVVHERK